MVHSDIFLYVEIASYGVIFLMQKAVHEKINHDLSFPMMFQEPLTLDFSVSKGYSRSYGTEACKASKKVLKYNATES